MKEWNVLITSLWPIGRGALTVPGQVSIWSF